MSNELDNEQKQLERPTLRLLPSDRRPVGKTACETCPQANWFATESGLNAYCRVMYMLTWPAAPGQVVKLCDGQLDPPEE